MDVQMDGHVADGAQLPEGFQAKLVDARSRLLDLTYRNKLLKYRPSQRKHLELHPSPPLELFHWLVEQEKTCSFEPAEDDGPSEVAEEWWTEAPQEQDSRRTLALAAPVDEESLDKSLRTLHAEAATVIEEQGYNALFLALGFLEWRDAATPDETIQSPLVLVPVSLKRRGINSKFHLAWDGEDPFHNLSLWEKLKEQEVHLPDPEDVEGIQGELDETREVALLLAEVQQRIESKPGWRLIPKVSLGFFSFTKFVMFKDLGTALAGALPAEATTLLEGLLEGDVDGRAGLDGDGSQPFDEKRVDELIDWSKAHYVHDADPSQIAAIMDALAGKSLIIEGPPGTGKSQTITNLIAELIANDRKVLFVSEKKAALDVVKKRLDDAGLGAFCLPLHSHSTTKKEFYKELQRAFAAAQSDAGPGKAQYDHLERQRKKLNEYAAAISTPLYPDGPDAVEVMGRLIRLRDEHGDGLEPLPLETGTETDPQAIQHCWRLAREYEAVYDGLGPAAAHPWRGTDPVDLNFSQQAQIRAAVPALATQAKAVLERIQQVAADYDCHLPTSNAGWQNRRAALLHLAGMPPIDPAILLDGRTDDALRRVEAGLRELEAYSRATTNWGVRVRADAWHQDLAGLSARMGQAAKGLFFLKPSYWRSKREFQALFEANPSGGRRKTLGIMLQLVDLQKRRARIAEAASDGEYLFGAQWKAETSDPVALRSTGTWIAAFRTFYNEKAFREDVLERLRKGISKVAIAQDAEGIDQAWTALLQSFDPLLALVRPDGKTWWQGPVQEARLEQLVAALHAWALDLDGLVTWTRFRAWLREVASSPLRAGAAQLETKLIPPSEFRVRVEWSIYAKQMDHAQARFEPLRTFNVADHDQTIREFTKLDQDHKVWSRDAIRQNITERVRRYQRSFVPTSELGIIHREIQKKARHLSIRKLLKQAGNVIMDIKPCFMMSPLSVAQYLPPGSRVFDVVIFDEASQIRPEDAYGTLFRGKQVIVVGDSQQLPPTSFFDHVDQDAGDEDDEEFRVGAFESILHLCRSSFPEPRVRMLRWHYRSRHESLIAPSNQEFYENRLQTFPSPSHGRDGMGLERVHVADGIYDRGKGQTNRIEAQTIAKQAMEHVRRHRGTPSLGIVAMSAAQQRAIEDALHMLRQKNPELDEFFQPERPDYVFVKNLETVQGDERDVIFISIGYGFDQDRRIIKAFGPVNKAGGERRLNVLFTRARERVLVFSNFSPKDLPLGDAEVRGVRVLRMFLEAAETGVVPRVEPLGGDTESPFEDAVKDFLQSQGFEVMRQVGCSGYRIDLAVVHNEKPGTFAIGIECDGATYHSSRVARERDRLRQHVLEKLGWRFHRVWSTDWVQRPKDAKAALVKAVRKAFNDGPIEVGTPTAAPIPSVEVVDDPPFVPAMGAPDGLFKAYEEVVPDHYAFEEPFHSTPWETMQEAILEVVACEAPVHPDVIVDRLRRAAGVGRAGRLVRGHVEDAISRLQRAKRLHIDGDGFVWNDPGATPEPRRRDQVGELKVQYIAPAEIREAARRIVEFDGNCPIEDLARETARQLGFGRVKTDTQAEVERILREGPSVRA